MLYFVLEELIPEMSAGKYSGIGPFFTRIFAQNGAISRYPEQSFT